MTEERSLYTVGSAPAEDTPHTHQFRFVASNKVVVRYCEQCGRSWVVSEVHELIHNRPLLAWVEILEEAVAREKLAEGC